MEGTRKLLFSALLVLMLIYPVVGAQPQQHHPLSEIFPIDENFNMSDKAVHNISYLQLNDGIGSKGLYFDAFEIRDRSNNNIFELNTSKGQWEIESSNLSLNNNRLLDFFGSQCSDGKVVTKINSRGNYTCTGVESLSSAENLSTTLEAGNVANQTINLSGNNITDAGDIKLGESDDYILRFDSSSSRFEIVSKDTGGGTTADVLRIPTGKRAVQINEIEALNGNRLHTKYDLRSYDDSGNGNYLQISTTGTNTIGLQVHDSFDAIKDTYIELQTGGGGTEKIFMDQITRFTQGYARFNDNIQTYYGSDQDFSQEFDSGNSQFEIKSSDIDGQGTTGNILYIPSGQNRIRLGDTRLQFNNSWSDKILDVAVESGKDYRFWLQRHNQSILWAHKRDPGQHENSFLSYNFSTKSLELQPNNEGEVESGTTLNLTGNTVEEIKSTNYQDTSTPTCGSSNEGAIRYNGTHHIGCDGASWYALYTK